MSSIRRVIHILLIEDDKLDQMDVKRTLDRRGILYQLTVATNGEEAIKLMRDTVAGLFKPPDVILLDLNMPKMNGFEVLDKIRQSTIWSDSKVFILTTSDDPSEKLKGRKYGISGYIIKPLKLESPSSLDAFNLMMDLMNI
jgi:CheY-like chemotaxis protein